MVSQQHCCCAFQSALPVGGATLSIFTSLYGFIFQSTLPVGGERRGLTPTPCPIVISIHAPRGGERPRSVRSRTMPFYFNPHSPWGERRTFEVSVDNPFTISIHAPRMGSDSTVKTYRNDRIKRSTLREPHFFPAKNAYFSPNSSMCATASRTEKQLEYHGFIRIIARLSTYVLHLRLVSIAQIVESNTIRRLVHQHFQRGTK